LSTTGECRRVLYGWIEPWKSEPGETGWTEETAMHKRNRRKTARRRAAFKKKQKKRRERAAGKGR
jgi:hypothetical protein